MKCIYCKHLTRYSSSASNYYLLLYCYGLHLLLYASFVVTEIERHGPYFTREPKHTIDFSNSTGAILFCSANGNPMPTIRWETKDGIVVNEIPGVRHLRHDNSLVFPPFRAEDYRQDIHSNVYQCIASNSVGTIRSRYIQVRAVVQQHYVVEVYDDFVTVGNTAVFRCHIPGFIKDFVDVVSWIQDSATLIQANDLPGDRFSVFSTGELHIRRVQQSDALKTFRCQVRHKLTGETMISSSVGRLYVTEAFSNQPPRITESKPLVVVAEGEDVELGCAAQGYPVPTYVWLRNAQPIRQIAFNRIRQIDGSLRIRQVMLSDSGTYRCTVNNSVGSEMIETQLIVTVTLSAEIHPRLETVDVGKTAQLNCTVSGTPVVSLEWLHNGQPIVTNSRIRLMSRNLLQISNIERRDKGMYQCLAHNDFDSVQASAQIDLGDDAPVFLSTFPEQTIQPGQPLSLKCVASGNPIPQVTWQIYDNIPVPDNSRYRTGDYVTRDALLVSYVNISNTTPEDGGLYTCTAANDVTVIRHSAKINIFGKPSVRIMPNMTAVAGERMSLTCPTGGHPIDVIIWEREGVRLPYNHRQKVFPNGTLTVVDLERATDEGRYTCIARQTKESRNAQGTLHVQVLVRPVIEPFSFPKSLHQSQRYNLLCTVVKGDQPIQIEWHKDSKKLSNGVLPKTNLIHVTEYSLTLAFESVQPDHRGNYTCVASNAAGSSSHSASMIIHVPPRWRIEPIDTSVVKGRNAVIDCDTDAYPPPTISWSRAEGLLREPPSEFKSITSNSHLRPYENGSLAIHNAQRSDSGYYMCAATNGIGPGLSKVIKLTVNVAAHFDTKFRAETVRKGLEAKIKCESIGDKPITISWLKDKLPFNPREDPRYELLESIVAEGIKSEIIIRNADRRDSSLFSCVTSNAYGHDDTNIQLIMQEPPDAPSDLKILEHDGRSARISWSPPYSGNSPIIHYLIQYKLETDKWTTRTPNITVSASETSVLVGGLRPVTNYQIRAFAINVLGKSESSEVIILKTIEETPGGPPLHIKAVPLSSKSIKVSWKPPRKDLQYGQIRGYYVGYKVFESLNIQQMNKDFVYKTLEVKNDGFVEECTISELIRSTKYQIIVQAYNSKGAGPSSEPVFVKTLDIDPPSAPTLSVVSATANAIQLSWTMNSDDSTPATGFILHHKKESEDWDELRLTDTKSYTHEWLKCGSRYQYYLIAFNSVGKSDASSIVSAKTDGTSPVAPDKNSLLSVNTSAATIYLDAFHDGGCRIFSFEVMYKLQKSRKWISLSNRAITDQKHIVLSDLMPSTTYDIKITAFNEGGSTEAQYSFTTSSLPLLDDEPGILSSSKSATPVPFYADVLVVVPSIISLVVVIILLSLVYVIFTRKPRHGSNVYSNYSPNKVSQQDCTESVNLTELDASHVKKLSMPSDDGCAQSMLHYPVPYAMTKISESEERVPLNAMSRSSPHKSYNPDHEIYATVKRTPRQPRSDVHIYQYPTNVQPDNSCELEASNAAAVTNQWRTSMVRFESQPANVRLLADPQSGLIYGRSQLRTTSSHNYK